MRPVEDTPAHPDTERAATGFAYMLRALDHRNYRLFFIGQGISLIGTWMTQIATSWLVYRLTNSALLLGVVGFAGQIPSFLLAPVAGVLVDRWNRHRLLLATQAMAMAQSLALAALTLTGVVKMVEKREDLSNAIALNSSMVNAARLLGPSLAGVIIAAVGEGWCFMLDGVSYLAVIASLLLMKLPRAVAEHIEEENVFRQFREGWNYIVGFPPIRNMLLLLALVSLVGMPYTVLMPVFANEILGGGPYTFGWLMAASGVGALM